MVQNRLKHFYLAYQFKFLFKKILLTYKNEKKKNILRLGFEPGIPRWMLAITAQPLSTRGIVIFIRSFVFGIYSYQNY